MNDCEKLTFNDIMFILVNLAMTIFLILFVLSMIPGKSNVIHYNLAIQEEFQEEKLNVSHKMNVSGGLCRMTSTDISFLVKDNGQIISKNIQYNGDITYVPSDKNTISYSENHNFIGDIMSNDKVIITYDKNLFTTE